MLTKKHFKAIASYIKEAQGDYNILVNKLINMCKNENPLFDEDKFRKACLKE